MPNLILKKKPNLFSTIKFYSLSMINITFEVKNNNLLIDPTKRFECKSNIIKTNMDHRIAMAFAIMGTKLGVNLTIQDSKYINTSFPGFSNELNSVGGCLSE